MKIHSVCNKLILAATLLLLLGVQFASADPHKKAEDCFKAREACLVPHAFGSEGYEQCDSAYNTCLSVAGKLSCDKKRAKKCDKLKSICSLGCSGDKCKACDGNHEACMKATGCDKNDSGGGKPSLPF